MGSTGLDFAESTGSQLSNGRIAIDQRFFEESDYPVVRPDGPEGGHRFCPAQGI